MNTFFGFKQGQTQDYDSAGKRWPITMVKVEPMTVINSKQVVFGHRKRLNKAQTGLLKNLAEKILPRYLREIKIEGIEGLEGQEGQEGKQYGAGTKINITDVFAVGDKIKVTGTSKGKGFAGVVKRHGFAGGPKSHGQSDRQRHGGSIGQTTTPGRVYKGKKMAGHMGVDKVTVKNLEVFAIKPEENLLLIKGLVPGGENSLLEISKLPK